MALPPLNLKIGADTQDLDRSLENVREQMSGLQGATADVAGGLRSFGDGATTLGRRMLPVSGAITAAGAALFGLAGATANAGNEIAKSARAANMSSDAFQEYRFALTQATDATEQDLSVAMRNLNKVLSDAAEGSEEAISKLVQIGFSAEEAASGLITTEDALGRTIEALGATDTGLEAAGIAAGLLGERIGRELGPQLREAAGDIDGLRSRARDLGLVLSQETLNDAEAATDKFREIGEQVKVAGHLIGAAMLPVLISLGDALQNKVIPFLTSVGGHIANAVEWFGSLPGPVQEVASVIATALGVGGPALLAIGAMSSAIGGIVAATGPIGLLIGAATLIAIAWARWGDDIKEIVADATDWITEKFTSVLDFFTGLPERFMQFGRDMIDGLRMGIDNAWQAVKDSIAEKIDWLPNWVKDRLGIASPSRVFMEIGENIGQGMAIGIENSFGLVQSAVQGLGQQVTNGAFDMANGVVAAMGQMFEGSKPIAAAQALINTFQGITEALKLPFPGNLFAAARVAAQGFAAVRGIQSARPGSAVGSAAAAGGGGSTPAQTQMQQMPTQTLRFDFGGQNTMGMEQMVNLLNDAYDRGYRIRAVMA